MLRLMMCSLPLVFGLLAYRGASAEAASLLVPVRTSCDLYGRCFEFSGPSDKLVNDGTDLWQRADPLALAHGTAGEPVEDLSDE